MGCGSFVVEFPYKPVISGTFERFWKTIAIVRVSHENVSYRCQMLVDSRADISLIPKSAGEYLRLSLEGSPIMELRGLGESVVPYLIKNVQITIGSEEINAKMGWALIKEVPFILGRLDIFDQFHITFDNNARKVVFRRQDITH